MPGPHETRRSAHERRDTNDTKTARTHCLLSAGKCNNQCRETVAVTRLTAVMQWRVLIDVIKRQYVDISMATFTISQSSDAATGPCIGFVKPVFSVGETNEKTLGENGGGGGEVNA